MQYIIVDLEATCWKGATDRDRMEIIEIGAVRMLGPQGPATDEFAAFVRPIASGELSDFCRELTSIKQTDVDAAELFPQVLEKFVNWIGEAPTALCSWGRYDYNQFEQDCRRHRLEMPAAFARHINLKHEYSQVRGSRPLGMAAALARENLELVGTHHRGIDDARNIARLAELILPGLPAEK